jgi:hypothetical protein
MASYNWQRWEADVNANQPRGYVDVGISETLDLNMEGPMVMTVEVVLEGKPKKGSLATALAVMLAMLSSRELPAKINSKIPDGSLYIAGPAEGGKLIQAIQGDIRVRRFTFNLPAIWGVTYV